MVKIYTPAWKRSENKPHFWVTNISDRNVCLADLALTIPARATVDLLSKHYPNLNKELLEKSAKDGSIYKKQDKIKVRNVPLDPPIKPGLYKVTPDLTKPLRSLVKIEEPHYEELDFSDEQFAEEAADTTSIDRNPLINPKKIKHDE